MVRRLLLALLVVAIAAGACIVQAGQATQAQSQASSATSPTPHTETAQQRSQRTGRDRKREQWARLELGTRMESIATNARKHATRIRHCLAPHALLVACVLRCAPMCSLPHCALFSFRRLPSSLLALPCVSVFTRWCTALSSVRDVRVAASPCCALLAWFPESDPAHIGFSSDHVALSTYAADASVRAGQMAEEFSKLAEQSLVDGEIQAEKERKIQAEENAFAKQIADEKAREAATRLERAARAARIAATRTRTFSLAFNTPLSSLTPAARAGILADLAKLMGVHAGRLSIVRMQPAQDDAAKTEVRFKVLAASAFKAPATEAAPAVKPKAAKPKDPKPAFQAPKPGKLGRRKGQQKLGVFVKPAGAAAPAAPKKAAAQTPLAKSTKRALASLAAALKSGAKSDALKANKVDAASLNQQTKAERAAARAARAAARVARRAAFKKAMAEFNLTRKNAKIALLKSLDAAANKAKVSRDAAAIKKAKAERDAAIKAFNKETRRLRRALRRKLRGDRKRDPILRGLLQAFKAKAKDARKALRAKLAAAPAKERKAKMRDLRRVQAAQRKEIIAKFRRERKVQRKQARKAAAASAVAAPPAAPVASAAPKKSSFMELLSAQDASEAIPDWSGEQHIGLLSTGEWPAPAHNRAENTGEKVRVLATGKPSQFHLRDASQAKYIRLLPKHTAAESYAEHFQRWDQPAPKVDQAQQIKRQKFLQPAAPAAKKPAPAPAAAKVSPPKLAPLPTPATVVPVPQSLVPVSAVQAQKSALPLSSTVESKSESWWTPWHICIVVMSSIAFLGLMALCVVALRRNKSDREPREMYAAV